MATTKNGVEVFQRMLGLKVKYFTIGKNMSEGNKEFPSKHIFVCFLEVIQKGFQIW